VLAERYRLMAAEGDELDLRIVDLYQANVDRPMESLSGGESFLASLALALGLSELASRHHPIDSLFIDEGFGTLDTETLEVALSALENLRSRGKTIGLISHVELLKERLTTQVRVLRGAGGTSRIEVVMT
jgi:exonuclease SbcC